MAGKISQDDEQPIAEINIVPFVDIILVVLIIFMVTTPFIIKPSISIQLPKAASGENTTPSHLNLSVAADGTTMVNGKPQSDAEISITAKEALAKNPATQAIISADKSVSHGRVVSLIDIIKTAGIHKFAITIEAPKK